MIGDNTMNGNVMELKWIAKMFAIGIRIFKASSFYNHKGADAIVYKYTDVYKLQIKQHVCSFSMSGWLDANAKVNKYRENGVHHVVIIEPDKYFNEDLARLLNHIEDINAAWLKTHIIQEPEFIRIYKETINSRP